MTTAELALRFAQTLERIQPLLWVVFIIVFLMWMTYSSILFYHWIRYGYKSKKMRMTSIVYVIGSIMLLGIALVCIVMI